MTLTDFIPTGFWPQVAHQLTRIDLEKPNTFDGVRAILMDDRYDCITNERNRNGVTVYSEDNAFFTGSGGNDSVLESLINAGWKIENYEADYYYDAVHPETNERLAYIEGDVERREKVMPVSMVVASTDYDDILELEALGSQENIVKHLAQWDSTVENPIDIGSDAVNHILGLQGTSRHTHEGVNYILSKGQYAIVLYRQM